MDRSEVLRQMIGEKQKLIELYQAMVSEWKKELGESGGADSVTHDASKNGGQAAGGDALSVVKEYEFHNKSQTEAAKIVLERVGYPLSTQLIVDAIARGGVSVGGKTMQAKKTNLYTILHRSKENFGLAAKDRWGLRGWKGIPKWEAKSDADENSEKDVEIEK